MNINKDKLVPLGLCNVTPVFARIKKRMTCGFNIYFCIVDEKHIFDIEDTDVEFALWLKENTAIVAQVDNLKEEIFNYMEKIYNAHGKREQ